MLMTIDMGLMVLVAFLVVWQLWLRTHVPLVIYATCAGFVLTTTWGPELIAQLNRWVAFFGSDVGQMSVSIFLFLAPPLLTALQFRGSMGHRLLQQFVPAFFGAVFVIAFTLRLLTIDARQALLDNSYLLGQVNELASWTVLLAIGVASIELLSQHDLLKARIGRKSKRE